MASSIDRRTLVKGGAGIAGSLFLGGCSGIGADSADFPGFVWSTYGTGTGVYNDMAALANVLTEAEGTPVRIIASDTGVGRIAPLIDGTAQYARTADEFFYAYEGEDEFATGLWGPQPIRLLWAPPTYASILVLADSGIETVSDLVGRRFPDMVASTALNRKAEAILGLEGLAFEDVQRVGISYSEQPEGLRTGQIDALYHNLTSPSMEELASEYGVRWLDLSADESAYRKWETITPTASPAKTGQGAALDAENPITAMEYTVPIVTTESRPADEVKELLSALDRNFDAFDGTTPDSPNFAPDKVLLDPLMVPVHEGAVAFFREVGRWSESLEKRNQALLEREEHMVAEWPGFYEAHSDERDLSGAWKAWKRENLPELPDASA